MRREKIEVIVSSVVLLILTFLFFKEVKSQRFAEWAFYILVFAGISFFICLNINTLNQQEKTERQKDE